MPAYKTFASYAEKLAKALKLIEDGKPKQAATIVKRVQASAEKRSKKAGRKGSSSPKKPSKYTAFIKANLARARKENPAAAQTDLFKILAKEYAKVKDTLSTPKAAKRSSSKKSPKKASPAKKASPKKSTRKSARK